MAVFTLLLFISCVFHFGLALPTKNKLRDVEWFEEGQKSLGNLLKNYINTGIAKNVIVFIGDGMGISTMTAARLLKAQQQNRSLFETRLAWEEFPNSAIVLPYNVDQFTAESAGSATAILTGVKTNGGMLSVNQKAIRGICESGNGNEVKSILHHSHAQGKWTGVLTTESITGATPAASYAHTPDRDWSRDTNTPAGCKDIAAQLVEDNDFIRVVLGGGRVNFMTINDTDVAYDKKGGRKDRNLIKVWEENLSKKVNRNLIKYVTNKTDFDAIDTSKVEYLMGLFEPGKMHYEVDRMDESKNKDPEPSLTEMVQKAIPLLQRSKDGFFLLVEGAKIDNGHHRSNAYRALTETLSMSEAVKKAGELTNEEDTLIVVTADHSHTFIINGYPHPDNDIFGLSRTPKVGAHDELELELGEDGLPYLTLSYGNGEGYMYHKTNDTFNGGPGRRNLTQEEADGKTRDKDYKQDAAVPKDDESHGGEDVGVYARGPMSHLFRGAQEQTLVAHIMMYASCVGPNKDHCKEVPISSGKPQNGLSNPLLILTLLIIWRV